MRVAFVVACAALLLASCGEGGEKGDSEGSPAGDGGYEFPDAPGAKGGTLDPSGNPNFAESEWLSVTNHGGAYNPVIDSLAR
jgi:hypothetical protein